MAEPQSNGHISTGDSHEETQDPDSEKMDPRYGVITGEMDKWEARKRRTRGFYDDGSMPFFWRAHRVLALVIFSSALFALAMYPDTPDDTVYNTKKGLVMCVVVLCVLGVTHIPDGPFRRPHPAFWKVMMALSVVYNVILVFILFQNAHDARQLMKHIDPSFGVPLTEKTFGGNCMIHDPDHPTDPWHNFKDKMDAFVPVHFFGWYLKTLVLRDYWMCTVISVMFEILEYTFEHQLPNFSECWWDHWLMDALICNGAGIYLGMKTLEYLSVRTYYWRSTWSYKTYRGKLSRVVKQFTPYFWTEFDWRPTQNLKRWLAMLWLIFIFLAAEVNTFYLKFTLWIPANHYINLVRLGFYLIWAAVSIREYYQFMEDPYTTKMGTQFWLMNAATIIEFFITIKFEWKTVSLPLPRHIAICWILGLVALVLWTFWNFYLHEAIVRLEKRITARRRKRSPASHEHDIVSSGSESEEAISNKAVSDNQIRSRERSKQE